MRKKLLVLNLALLALAGGAAWRLRAGWLEARQREQQALRKLPGAPTPFAIAAERPPQPVAAASYGEIAEKMLFSQDRNPNVVLEVTPPKPLPPLPFAHGVVNFGDGPVVILSERSGGAHRGYSPGEKVGDFTVVAVSAEDIVLEFEGQQLKKKLAELKDQTQVPAAPASGVQSTTVEAPTTMRTTVETPASPTGPGVTMYGQVKACQAGDPTPPGTIMNGLRKVETASPFGRVCRWEPVQ